MKTISKISGIILAVILIQACKKEEDKPTLPVLTTTNVTVITRTTASSGGNVTSDGGAEITVRGICWGTTTNPMISGSKTTDGVGKGSFTSSLTNLNPNSTYYIRAYATNSVGTSYGNEVSFTTNPKVIATVSTSDVTSLTSSSAVSGGNISDDGGSDIVSRGVCWSTSVNPTLVNSKTENGTGIGTFKSDLTGLTANTTYYLRAYSINSIGTSYGNEISFTTLQISIPVLTTLDVTKYTSTRAEIEATIINDGGNTITSSGVCWSTNNNPTIDDNKIGPTSGVLSFYCNISSLTPNTTYYTRAFATNSAGTAYGNEVSFTTRSDAIIFNPSLTYGSLSDADGNSYKTVQIGSQVWVAENLKTTVYNDGTPIPLVTGNVNWPALSTPGYCWFNNDAYYKNSVGALYNWYAINTSKICPIGWHVPIDAEWTTLTDYLGGESIGGVKIKEVGMSHWTDPTPEATNESGFTALPSGARDPGGYFSFSWHAFWWSSTEGDVNRAWGRTLYDAQSNVERGTFVKTVGASVRCVKD